VLDEFGVLSVDAQHRWRCQAHQHFILADGEAGKAVRQLVHVSIIPRTSWRTRTISTPSLRALICRDARAAQGHGKWSQPRTVVPMTVRR
jgi:hypothetical protein